MEIGDDLIEEIHFVNEYGQVVNQVVEYDWLPVKCKSCHCFGHSEVLCRKKEEMKWKSKAVPTKPTPEVNVQQVVVNQSTPEVNVVSKPVVEIRDGEGWITPRKNQKYVATTSKSLMVGAKNSERPQNRNFSNGLCSNLEHPGPK